MKLDLKTILRPALTLMLICLIVTAGLGGVDALTKDRIAQLAAEAEQQARAEVLASAESFDTISDTLYAGKGTDGTLTGYVIITEANGYGGKIRVMTGIAINGEVTGISILSHNETVGLGANCAKESFWQQFLGLIPGNDKYTVYKFGAAAPAEGGIEAVSSATISSTAVVKAVNDAVAIFRTQEGVEN
jgi:electron transport complex protein RnfG